MESDNLPAPTDDDLPVFLGEDWETYTSAWIQCDESVNTERWKQAAIAASLRGRFGESAIPKFAAQVNSSSRRIYRYAATYIAWRNKRVSEVLSFHHHTLAANATNPEQAIEKAEIQEWSTRQLESAVKHERATGVLRPSDDHPNGLEDNFEPSEVILSVGMRLCPNCNGTGTVKAE